LATESTLTESGGKNPSAINDRLEPDSSGDHKVPFFHWWPKKGTTEWAQYDFGGLHEVSKVAVYWFDDTGVGECRVPASWRVLYRDSGAWHPVYTTQSYGVEKDRFNEIVFETVRTDALRIEVTLQGGFSAGIHEWTVK
jgi:hypothetical protein